jgi:error-prone DNA polymerase
LTTHLREDWDALGVVSSQDLAKQKDRSRIMVAGLVITRQAPSTAKEYVFITLEDEFGTVNTILRPNVFQRYNSIALRSSVILMEGQVVHDNGAINVLVERIPYGTEHAGEALSHDFH